MSQRLNYSTEQIELLNIGIAKGIPLLAIANSPDFLAASKSHREFVAKEREGFKAYQYLDNGSDGPFTSREEREAAFSHPLYHTSEEYRIAVRHKAAQSSNEIMGIYTPPDPLSPAALMRAAQLDSYNAIKADLFDKASENNPNKVEATQARQRILELAQSPEYQEVMSEFEPPRRPMEESLKATGPWIINTFPQGTEAEMQAEAIRRDNESSSSRPGGRGDGGVEGPSNTTWGR